MKMNPFILRRHTARLYIVTQAHLGGKGNGLQFKVFPHRFSCQVELIVTFLLSELPALYLDEEDESIFGILGVFRRSTLHTRY